MVVGGSSGGVGGGVSGIGRSGVDIWVDVLGFVGGVVLVGWGLGLVLSSFWLGFGFSSDVYGGFVVVVVGRFFLFFGLMFVGVFVWVWWVG